MHAFIFMKKGQKSQNFRIDPDMMIEVDLVENTPLKLESVCMLCLEKPWDATCKGHVRLRNYRRKYNRFCFSYSSHTSHTEQYSVFLMDV